MRVNLKIQWLFVFNGGLWNAHFHISYTRSIHSENDSLLFVIADQINKVGGSLCILNKTVGNEKLGVGYCCIYGCKSFNGLMSKTFRKTWGVRQAFFFQKIAQEVKYLSSGDLNQVTLFIYYDRQKEGGGSDCRQRNLQQPNLQLHLLWRRKRYELGQKQLWENCLLVYLKFVHAEFCAC